MLGAAGVLASPPASALPELSAIARIASGSNHSCAVTVSGGVKCWGFNNAGQLGDNSAIQRMTAVDVSNLSSGVIAIAAGSAHTCALTLAGGVKCWGSNVSGQLGDKSTINRLTPVDVLDTDGAGLLSGVVAISANLEHTCALTAAGGMKCWGYNGNGELGDNTTINRLTPVDVAGTGGVGLLSGIAAIATGGGHSCALTSSGAVKCWGYNGSGQLGDNSTINRLTPVDVSGTGGVGLLSGVKAIAAGGSHTCVVTISGGVKCWGNNAYGQLGDGSSSTPRLTPVDTSGVAGGTAIVAGGAHACALTAAGGVKCWGFNSYGQLGDNTASDRVTAVDVSSLATGITAIAAGGYHTCALTAARGVKCWGNDGFGQLGDNFSNRRLTPVDVAGLGTSLVAIATGELHSCALSAMGAVKCWGSNAFGQLGDNSRSSRLMAVDVSGLGSGVTAIAAGAYHTCALVTSIGVKCWGRGDFGQLGDNATADRLTPTDVTGLAGETIAIAAGGYHGCALSAVGGMKCWGYNAFGQLGDNSTDDRLTPVNVWSLTGGVASMTTGAYHTCVRTEAAGMKCWGYNGLGQLGDDSSTNRFIPIDVPGLTSAVLGVSSGYQHTCALTSPGGVRCWGWNNYGQLGDSSTNNRSMPVDVLGIASGMTTIAAGHGHTCALSATGVVKCWGYNSDGQLGDGTNADRLTPGEVTELADSAVAVASGGAHTCALTAAGGAKCWGSNDNGQLGDGTGRIRPFPAPVLSSASLDLLSLSPATVDFGGQSMQTSAPPRTVALTNAGGSPVTVSSIGVSSYFTATHNCTTLAPAASCTVNVTFTPTVQGSLTGTLTITSSAGTQTVALAGTGEKSLVTHYYRSILRRDPDVGGKAYWESVPASMQALGANTNETWYAMAASFYFSAEYLGFNRTNAELVGDLYNTFFNRPADAGGLAYWTGQLAQGMPREVVLVSFMFSTEFATFTQGIFGNTAVRAENDTVMDFYRGLLSRLPDAPGFNFWVGQFRIAQCSGASAVYQKVESISSQFATGTEYLARSRTNAQYVGDLYNSFLRRGGDLAGVQFWISQLTAGTMTREFTRKQFIASSEFTNRVNAIVAQGCLP